MSSENLGKINILGPCAAESRDQLITVAQALKEKNVGIMRASWWKPRTTPSFDGVGVAAAPWFAEATRLGLTVATEVMLPSHVSQVMKGIIDNDGNPQNVLVWLGSRNQNHMIQKDIARTLMDESPSNVKLMIKNQPWFSEAQWLGILDHVVSTGFPPERIIMCHRGFSPGKNEPNPQGLRNLPDWEMAMNVKEKTRLPMIIDSSHIGGSRENVWRAMKEASQFPFDGHMLEIHPDPKNALSDSKQQLSIADMDKIIMTIGGDNQ